MASRAIGAFFSLAAAAAFVVSIASSAFWAGHPVVDGKEITAKHVRIGPLGATGCNIGGDGSCESIAVTQEAQIASYATLGAAGLATLFALLVFFAAAKVSERRRGLALALFLFAMLAAGGAGAMFALGPGIVDSHDIHVPISWGIHAFGGGVLASLLACLVTRKLEPEPLRLKPSVGDVAGEPHGRKTPQPPPELAAYMQARQSQSQLEAQAPRQTRRPSKQRMQAQPVEQPPPPVQPQPVVQPSSWQDSEPVPAWQREPVNPFAQTALAAPAPSNPAANDPLMGPGQPGVSSARNGAPSAAGSGAMRAHDMARVHDMLDDMASMDANDSGPMRAKPPTAPPRTQSPMQPLSRNAPSTNPPPFTTPTSRPRSPSGAPKMSSSARTKAASAAPPMSSTSTPPRTKPSSAPPPLAAAVDDIAHSKPTTAPPPLAANARGDAAARSKPMAAPPPLAGNPSAVDEIARSKPTTAPPPLAAKASLDDARSKPTTAPPPLATKAPLGTDPARSKPTSVPPHVGAKAGGPPAVDTARSKPTTAPPPMAAKPAAPAGDAARSKSTSAPPPIAGKPGDVARSKPTSGAPPIAGKSLVPAFIPPIADLARNKPPSVAPPGGKPGAATKLPSIVSPPKKPVVPVPAARAKTTQDPQPAGALLASTPIANEPNADSVADATDANAAAASDTRPSTEPGAAAPQPGTMRASRPNMTPVPTRSPTVVAHAVPPPPMTGMQSSLDDDDDEEISGRARSIGDNDARAGIVAGFGAAPIADDTDASLELDDAPPRRRSATDMETGKSSAVGDTTQTGLEAPMPARAKLDVAVRAAINLRLPELEPETTAQTEPPTPEVLAKTIHDPETPIPTLGRNNMLEPADPVRARKVPISTAPSTLPPPKELEAVPSGPSPACPQCESPMSWVDEHLRFYCRACRMYF